MKLLSAAVIACCGVVMTAHAQVAYKTAKDFDWKIAQRLDSGRVVIMLTEDEASITVEEHATLEPEIPKPAKEFLAVFLSGLRPLSEALGRRSLKNTVALGDRWAIDAGRAGWFETSVDGFVLADEGCSEVPAVAARVTEERIPAFAKVREKYFPARAIPGWSLPAKTTSVGPSAYVVTPQDRQNIEVVLRRAFARESPRILQKAASDSHAVDTTEIREKYRQISAGRGTINFDVQAFRVTPDGLPRLFVRAVWNLDGKSVFLMNAWLRTAPAIDIDGADFHSAEEQLWMDFKLDGPMDLSSVGEVLNVVDVDRDGQAEIVMLYHFYEGISIEVSKYPPAGPGSGQVIAKYGAGC